MKVNKITIAIDMEMDLTEEEELAALEVGTILLSEDEDHDILIKEALQYWIILGLIQEV